MMKFLSQHQMDGCRNSRSVTTYHIEKLQDVHKKVPEHAGMLATVFYADIKRTIDRYGK